MINHFCKHPLWECNDRLVRVAQGLEPADLVIRHARLVDVCTHEVLDDTDIAVASGRVAYVGMNGHTADHCIGENTKVVDATGLFASPGFMDGHIHVESAMVGVSEYARAVVPHGTTGIFTDPHEVANVCGLEGVKVMFDDAKRTPLKAMVTIPSCVPAATGVEDTGSKIDAADIRETMGWDNVVALGEMMNFPGILGGEAGVQDEVRETLKADRCVTGHYAVPEQDRGLNAYIARGNQQLPRVVHRRRRARQAAAWACTCFSARGRRGRTCPCTCRPSSRLASTCATASSAPMTTIPTRSSPRDTWIACCGRPSPLASTL